MGERQSAQDLQLDVQRIIMTVGTLHNRIEERFPNSGLGRLAGNQRRLSSWRA